MSIPDIQFNATYQEQVRLSRVVAKAMDYRKNLPNMLAEHRDFFTTRNVSPSAVEQVLTRMIEARAAFLALDDADVKAWLATQSDALPADWEAGLAATVAELDKAIAATVAVFPVSADGTAATIIVNETGISRPPFLLGTLTGVAEALDAAFRAI